MLMFPYNTINKVQYNMLNETHTHTLEQFICQKTNPIVFKILSVHIELLPTLNAAVIVLPNGFKPDRKYTLNIKKRYITVIFLF